MQRTSPRMAAGEGPVGMFEALEPRQLLSVVVGTSPPVDPVLAAAAAVQAPAAAALAAPDLGQTFLLHSCPTANHRIYLDFDGSTTIDPYWNNGKAVVMPAFDIDGNTSAFSSAELERIQYIWQRVAEDYAPFNVDVTTQEPAAGDLINSGGSDSRWGIRVVIGGYSSWYGPYGGVAYVGSFTWGTDTPCFVFANNLGNGNEKYTAEAITHEAGHTLGLYHDGRTTPKEEYYEGQGNWAPIEGVGYYKPIVQWSKGEYAYASNTEDDLSIITSRNGFTYRADADAAGPLALSVSGSSVSGSGIIERTSDVDTFRFVTGAGTITLNVGVARDPDLDVLAELVDADGVVVASANPTGAMAASITATVAAGAYTLRISGVGEGDPVTTGYSDYGSLGQYAISGTIVPPGPLFAVSDVTVNETAGSAAFVVSLSQAAADVVTVDVFTANGTAAAGSDYTAVNQTVTFQPGQTQQTVLVPILDDSATEPTETFTLNLTNPVGAAVLDASGLATIIDDDVPPVTIAISNASVTETNPGPKGALRTTDLTFTVSLSAAATQAVTVQYATANGTALAGSDYTAATGTISFAVGETSKTVTVKVIGDTLVETSETVLVNLTNATGGATIADSQGVGTIVDNDTKGKPPRITVFHGKGLALLTPQQEAAVWWNLTHRDEPDND